MGTKFKKLKIIMNDFNLYKGAWISSLPPHKMKRINEKKCNQLLNVGGI